MNDEEQLAWVDENENVIQVVPYSLANSDPEYLHLEIAGLIIDNQKKVLLQQRSFTKKVGPGIWTVTVAGHVTHGDTLEQTFHKELKEEMGISTDNYKYLFREKVILSNETHFCHWYLGKYLGDKIKIQTSEVEDYAWISEKEFEHFCKTNKVSDRTIKMAHRFWLGEWDNLIK